MLIQMLLKRIVKRVKPQLVLLLLMKQFLIHMLNYITRYGHFQTGSFLDVAAPNGLFGLGMEKISVPSLLSREGFTADSFSMCFGQDGVGRISFGDKGKNPVQLQTITVSGNFCVLDANACPAQPHKDFYLIQQCKDLISAGTWSVRVSASEEVIDGGAGEGESLRRGIFRSSVAVALKNRSTCFLIYAHL